MTTTTQKTYYTPEEYLTLEEKAEYKHEYRNGEIIPMVGGTSNHNIITLNVAAYLKFDLKGQNYLVYMSDMRLWIPNYKIYTYPDVMVIQGKPITYKKRNDTLTNPSLIVEVLSKSTQSYDQGEKFNYYRSLPELQEYILISQYEYFIMYWTKLEEKQWLLTDLKSPDSILSLKSLNVQISCQDIYENVEFSDKDEAEIES